MRCFPFCSISLLISAISWLPLACFAQAPEPVTLSLRPTSGTLLIVPVKVSGDGPYDFVLDTGSTATMIDSSLFKELRLQKDGTTEITSMAKEQTQAHAIAKEIELGGLTVQNLEVISISSLNFGSANHRVRGILGENFLEHFDLLIDNEHRQITLDAAATLSESFQGERLPLTTSGNLAGTLVLHRPVVSATVPSYDTRPLHLLLDSGSEVLAILPHQSRMGKPFTGGSANLVPISTPNGSLLCASWKDKLRWGSFTRSGVNMVSCGGTTEEEVGHDGSLPTSLFKQILISHTGSYVIVNPVARPL